MIQKITEHDLASCTKVIQESFLTVARDFELTIENAPRFTAFATTKDRLNWQYSVERRPMYAYFENGRIIVYYSLNLNDQECELNNLCVLPPFRHHGIGRQLLLHAIRTAQLLHCKKMNLGIIEENQCLKNWYESFGFLHTQTQKFDFFPFTCGYMEKEL